MAKFWPFVPVLQLGRWQNTSLVTSLWKGSDRLYINFILIKPWGKGPRGPKINQLILGQCQSMHRWHWDQPQGMRKGSSEEPEMAWLHLLTFQNMENTPSSIHTGWSPTVFLLLIRTGPHKHKDELHLTTFIEQWALRLGPALSTPPVKMFSAFIARGKFVVKRKGQNVMFVSLLLVHAETWIIQTLLDRPKAVPEQEWPFSASNKDCSGMAGKFPGWPAWNFSPDLGPLMEPTARHLWPWRTTMWLYKAILLTFSGVGKTRQTCRIWWHSHF